MDDVIERIINKGISQGLSQGRAEGKEEVIRKMLDAKFATAEQIAEVLEIPVEEVRKIADKVLELA